MPEHALEKRRKPSPFIPPTPPPTPYTPETRQRIMAPEKTPTPSPTPYTVETRQRIMAPEKKAAKEAVDSMARTLARIPGVTPLVEGDRLRVRIQGNSLSEIKRAIEAMPPQVVAAIGKTMCDGEPVRIT